MRIALSYDIIISVPRPPAPPTPHRAPGRAPRPTAADVLAAAEGLLEQAGPEALSMRALARELGTSYQVVYSRIGGKGDVARALHDDGFARMCRLDGLGEPPGSTAHVVALALRYLAFARSHPALFELMFGAPIPELVRDDASHAVEVEGFRRTWVAAVRGWLDAHHPERPRPTAVRLAWRLWTAVHGITVLDLAGHTTPSGDVTAEVEGVVRRLLTDPLAD